MNIDFNEDTPAYMVWDAAIAAMVEFAIQNQMQIELSCILVHAMRNLQGSRGMVSKWTGTDGHRITAGI
jgi:hypothetical protein